MAESAENDEVFWVDPEKRGIIPLDGFHVSRSLKKRLMNGGFHFTTNTCFSEIVDRCADRSETWINPTIRNLYMQLHKGSMAHSVEVWDKDGLAGGLYGVSIAGAFFGESMFSTRRNGSKLALIALIARLRAGGFTLLDTQFHTEHLATLGGVEITKDEYRGLLNRALDIEADFWELPQDTDNQELWQLSTQTS